MTISKRVQQELQQVAPDAVSASVPVPDASTCADLELDDVQRSTLEARARREALAAQTKGQAWTKDEHQRFLAAVALYPSGPWEAIAEHVGTKNARQTMTHAQKCRQKNERRARGLRSTPRRKKSSTTTTTTTTTIMATTAAEDVVMAEAIAMPEVAVATPPPTPAPSIKTDPSVDSPRSGEEECVDQDPAVDPTHVDLTLNPLLTFDDSLVREIFDQYPAPLSLQSMWSTSSFPDAPVEIGDLDDLSMSMSVDDFALQWAV